MLAVCQTLFYALSIYPHLILREELWEKVDHYLISQI